MKIYESPSAMTRKKSCSLATCKLQRSPYISAALFVLCPIFPMIMWRIYPLLLQMTTPYPISPRFPLEEPTEFNL
jgi:hypothetical protein